MAVTQSPQAPEPTVGSAVKTAIQLLASVLGLAAYVYLIGGVVSWVRFGAARLPADVATATLTGRQLFEVGFRSLILMAVVFTAMCVVAYLAAGWRWGPNGPDWHEVISRGGVTAARRRVADPKVHEAWQTQRSQRLECARARRAGKIARTAGALRLSRISERQVSKHDTALRLAEKQKPIADRRDVWYAHLGDRAVRVVAGFNTVVLAVVAGLLAARFIEWLFPDAWWAILLAGFAAAAAVYLALSRWGPLKWPAWAHAVAWVLVAVTALFVTAPLGLLLIAGLTVSTLGRPLARTHPPDSLAGLLRSPLPWALFTFYGLVGLAFYAVPPVSFSRVVVSTTGGGVRMGAFLSRAEGGLYMATCTPLADATSINERVVFIDSGQIKQTTVGGQLRLDSGQRPSLVAFLMQAAGINAHPPTWFRADLRARRAACAGGPPAGLTIGTAAPALGPGVISGPAPAGGQAHDGETPVERTTPAAIARLARLYQPTIETAVADRFWPVSVGAVLHDVNPATNQRTDLCHVATPIACANVTSLASLVPSSSRPSDYLRFPAALRNDPSDQFRSFENGQSLDVGSLHNWLANPDVLDPWYTAQVYFYYAGPIDSGVWPSRPPDPDVPSRLIGLEYWFFYPFNYYPTVVGAELMQDAPVAGDGANTDLHQGDWEHITVLLNPKSLAPEWLYTARHADEGRFLPWTSPTLAFDGTHPIAQAAFGGHPTYDNHCGARLRGRLSNLSADWVICGSGRFAFRAASTPLVDLAQMNWACWKGHFGEAKPGLEVNATAEADDVISEARKFVFVAGPISPLWQGENGNLSSGTGPCARPGGPQAVESAGLGAVKSNRR